MRIKKKYPWNVLVFPAASEIGFEIYRALCDSKEVILHGANQLRNNITIMHFKRLHALPSIQDVECLPYLQGLIAEQQIDAIYPACYDVLDWLVQHKSLWQTEVIALAEATCSICHSKRTTYKTRAGLVPTPRLMDAAAVAGDDLNTTLIALIFQCRNRAIAIHLLIRHKSDLDKTLYKYHLSSFFNRIMHIPDDQTSKAKFILEENTVPIDDSFAERHAVMQNRGIRCFDASAALCLLDQRR